MVVAKNQKAKMVFSIGFFSNNIELYLATIQYKKLTLRKFLF